MQPMLHVQLVRNLVDCGLDPQQALDAPRWYLHGTGRTQSEADMRHSALQLEAGYGGRWDGQHKRNKHHHKHKQEQQQALSTTEEVREEEEEEGVVVDALRALGHMVQDIVHNEVSR